MKSYSQFDKQTGIFTSQIVTGMRPQESETHGWLEGAFDHTNQCVSADGRIIPLEHDPTAPLREARKRRRRARAQIQELERRTLRRMRELLAASDPKLQEIDDQIAALREKL